MRPTVRPYSADTDYWAIRQFLRDVMVRNGRRERSWHVARLDYWWWFANPFLEHLAPEASIFLWETAPNRIAAVLNPEGHGQAFLQVDPAQRTDELVEAMIATAEERLAVAGEDGRRTLTVFADSGDGALQAILARRGFERMTDPGASETQHRRSLEPPLPEVPATPGYAIRPLGDGLELLERCYASGLAFHEDDIAVALENRDHPDWYRGIQAAPLYRRDLDLIAVAPDGAVAAFCTVWFDDVTRTAYVEPVATVPSHRRRGLARAVLLEGLHRLRRMGCAVAFVGGYSEAANTLYGSVMGPEHDVSEPWRTVLRAP